MEVKTFENRLDRYWKNHLMKYDYTADYGPTRGNDQTITQSDETTEMNIEVQHKYYSDVNCALQISAVF